MIITCTLSEEDYLVFYLYTASKNKNHQIKSFYRRILTSCLFLVSALLMLHLAEGYVSLFFLFLGIACFAFYSHYLRWTYTRHYKKHIRTKLHKLIGQSVSLRLEETGLHSQDRFGESAVQYEAIEQLIELPDYFLLLFIGGSGFPLPKTHLNEQEKLALINQLVTRNKIPFQQEPAWHFSL